MTIFAFCITACTQANTSKNMKTDKKILVAFFSRTGENYAVGYIKKGNTHIIAEMIAEETGGELFQIEPVNAYPEEYEPCTEIALNEKNANARPAIQKDIAVEDYDVIFLGYPNWWSDMPMCVYTFIERHDWKGKTVIPFCTNEGSGLSGTKHNIETSCRGSKVLNGLAIRGSVAQNSRSSALKSVQAWLKGLNL